MPADGKSTEACKRKGVLIKSKSLLHTKNMLKQKEIYFHSSKFQVKVSIDEILNNVNV